MTERPRRRGGWDALAICGVLAVAAAVVAGLAWTRPASKRGTLAYTQSGHLFYGAPVSPTSIYGTTQVSTGQPVYTNVVQTLAIQYRYRFRSAAPMKLSGTEQLVATMSNGQGITRTVPLQAPTPFQGNDFDATTTLSLPALQAVAFQFASASAGGEGTYDLSISPSVDVKGSLGHVPIHAAFDEPVKFSLSKSALTPIGSSSSTTLAGPATGAAGSGPSASQSTRRFSTTASGSLTSPRGQPATLFLGLAVTNLRVAALIVLVFALVAGAFVGWPLLRDATSEDERRRIVARHGPSLIDVGALPTGPGVTVVELASFEGLLQVAQRTECPLLHANLGGVGHTYGVVDNGTLYRYGDHPSLPTVMPALAAANGNGKPMHLAEDPVSQGLTGR